MLLYDPHFQSWSIPIMKFINADASRITLLVSFPYDVVIIGLPQHLQVVSPSHNFTLSPLAELH